MEVRRARLARRTRNVRVRAAGGDAYARGRRRMRTEVAADHDAALPPAVVAIGEVLPVIANGGISNMDDVRRRLKVTGADGVMGS